MSQNEINHLKDLIEDLQSRVLFQEDTLQQLDNVVIQQSRQIDLLQQQVKILKDRLEAVRSSPIRPFDPDSDRPPHY